MNQIQINQTRQPWLFRRQTQSRILIVLAALATLVAIFYLEEDWRGKRAWENCKRELEAKGAVLDWNKFIPPHVPDDQNFFTASTNILLRFKKVQTEAEADAVKKSEWLRIDYSTNCFAILDTAQTGPLVVAEISMAPTDVASPAVSGNRPAVVKLNASSARQQVQALIRTTVGQGILGAAGFHFSERQLSNLTPAQIVLQSDTPPSLTDLADLIPEDLVTDVGHLRIEAVGDRTSFKVLLTGVRTTAAADYLKWSDQFTPALDEIRAALKRPYAIIPGDYSQPYSIPIPNFVGLRSLAQTLAQRADCYLLLGQPKKALREVSLIHDVCRILEKPPIGKPETLVEAMINVAISGLYANTVADGLRWRAWQEPQLAALQKQLAQIDLPKVVVQAFNCEPAAITHTLETVSTVRLREWFSPGWKWALIPQIKSALIPRGWIYQNMATSARLVRQQTEGCNLTNDLIQPREFGDLNHELDAIAPPYKFIAAATIPNFTKAWQTTAHNQTLVNEAQIVCALDRFRLAHGDYPETLDALMPQFIEKIPHDLLGGQPLHYRRTDDGNFSLYSVGWNETDDGGQISGDRTKGDWVWQYPLK